jgi:hypothetical protein
LFKTKRRHNAVYPRKRAFKSLAERSTDSISIQKATVSASISVRRCHWLFGGEYLQKQYLYNDLRLPLAQITGEGGYYLNLLSDGSKTFFLSLGVSGMAGYETINWNDKLLPDGATIQNADAFIYGGALTLETEIYLTDFAALMFNVRERILWGSTVGKFNTQIGVGIKFIIN